MSRKDVLMTRIVVASGALPTLLILPHISFDPINVIKLCALVVCATALAPELISQFRKEISKLTIVTRVILLMFSIQILFQIFSFTAHLNNWEEQFWGTFGRNNGALFYFSIFLIFAFSSISTSYSIPVVERYFVLTGNMVLLYAILQILDLDPIAWSGEGPFSTLGNINFSSAFLGIHASYLLTRVLMGNHLGIASRVWFALIFASDLGIIWYSQSIQGLFICGLSLVLLSLRYLWRKCSKILSIMVTSSYFFVGVTLLSGLFGFGPGSYFRQETLLYRLDYWLAGLKMAITFPTAGVGIDSYGDFYREFRSLEAVNRTGPDRVTNTAHNIPIDIASGSGLISGFCALLIILVLGGFLIRRVLTSVNSSEVALCLTSIGFLSQQLFSINQIGVASWGWILSGMAVHRSWRSFQQINPPRTKSTKSNAPDLIRSEKIERSSLKWLYMQSVACSCVGALLVLPAMTTNIFFNRAAKEQKLADAWKTANAIGGNQLLKEFVLERAVKSNDADLAKDLASELVVRHPRNWYAWNVIGGLSVSTDAERREAIERLRVLDPLNPRFR